MSGLPSVSTSEDTMARYKVLAGQHIQIEGGRELKYRAGEIVESDRPLDEEHYNKYQRVMDDTDLGADELERRIEADKKRLEQLRGGPRGSAADTASSQSAPPSSQGSAVAEAAKRGFSEGTKDVSPAVAKQKFLASLDRMGMKELQELAAEEEIDVRSGVDAAAVRTIIRKALGGK